MKDDTARKPVDGRREKRLNMTGDGDMKLAEGFQPASYEEWKALVEKALKGADFERALATETYDGFRLKPLYTAADAPPAPARPTSGRGARPGAWDIRQAVTGPSAAEARAEIVEELGAGATSVLLRFDAALRHGTPPTARMDLVGADGAALHTSGAIAEALADVDLAKTPVALDAGAGGVAAAAALLNIAGAGGLAPGSSLGLDPVSAIATARLDGAGIGAWAREAADDRARAGAGVTLMNASSVAVFDAGASEADELGALVASGLAYLRALETVGVPVPEAAGRIGFTIALSQDQFMTIAKARAARTLWAAVLKHVGASDAAAAMRLDGVTGVRMYTRHDPHVNVLRAAIAGFAGAVGGVDAITVLPFDARVGGTDPLARRIARNLQIMLAEESNLARVVDPGGGSFYVERLTTELAKAGWAAFQEIERAGGVVAAIEDGMLAERIGATAAERAAKAAKRREAITGVSEYANLADAGLAPPDNAAVAAAAAADWRAGGPLLPEPVARGEGPLALAPVSAPFEALRDAADAYRKRTDAAPAVFFANIGKLAEFNVRAGFAANALAAGGVGVAGRSDVGYGDAAAAAAAFKESGAKVACICGSDAGYAEKAASFAAALKDAGAKEVWLAGRPGAAEAELKAAGVDAYLFMGGDMLEALAAIHRAIGV